jgi:branched-chain amino acid transport system ATP-binding protein
METSLELSNLNIVFGGLKAVTDLNLKITRGQIFGLIGPNGAGKTTVFNMVTGVYKPTSGTITANGQRVEKWKSFARTRAGVARTFQNIRLFKDLSVLENLKIAMDQNPRFKRPGIFASILQNSSYHEIEEQKEQLCFEILSVFKLEARFATLACNLPYGDQRRLEMARALATGAKLLLLDEPAAGLNPQESSDLMDCIRLVRKQFGATIFLIEHDMKVVMGICDHIAVLDYGVKIAEGTPTEIQRNERVIAAYLGRRKA